jgi:hypothetical protein
MKRTTILMLIAVGTIIFGCTNMAPEEEDPTGCTPEFPEMDVTYENYVKGIVTQYCIECHHTGNSTGPGDFTTYNGLMAYTGSSFYFRVIQDGADMPQGNAPLPKAIRDSLDVWIRNCAPQN